MKVNFTGVKPSRGFDPLVGEFEMIVEEGEKRISKSEKNPGSTYISWTLRVVEGDREGAKAWYITSLVDAALPMLMTFLQAAGIDTDGEVDFEIEDVVGARLSVRCNEKDGKTNIVSVKPLDTGEASYLP